MAGKRDRPLHPRPHRSSAGSSPRADADKRTLIRRATYDLIGLPPTPEEVDAFLADDLDRTRSPKSSTACSPRRTTASAGAATGSMSCATPTPRATTPTFRSRRCTAIATGSSRRSIATCPTTSSCASRSPAISCRRQTTPKKHERIIATGYIANARRFGSRVDDYPQHLTIEDTIDNLGRAFLGLTVNCARCHDHKFDPITAEDYYALYGIFHSTRYPWPGIELEQKQRDLVPLASAEEVSRVSRSSRRKSRRRSMRR